MHEDQNDERLRGDELDMNAPIEVAISWRDKHQIVFVLAPMAEIVEKGYDRDLLCNQTTGSGASLRGNAYPAQAEFFDKAVRGYRGNVKGLDMSVDGWEKKVPYIFKSAVSVKIMQVLSLDAPVLEDEEKNV